SAAFDRHHVIADGAHRAIAAAVEPETQWSENADHGTGQKPEEQQGDAPRPRCFAHLPRMNQDAEPLRVVGKEAEETLIGLNLHDVAAGFVDEAAVPMRRVAAVEV